MIVSYFVILNKVIVCLFRIFVNYIYDIYWKWT